jgi:Bacterial Peptidase A24 N-terminal domain
MMDGHGAQNQETTQKAGPPHVRKGEFTSFRGERSRYAAWLVRALGCLLAAGFLLALAIVFIRDGRSFIVRRPSFAVDWIGVGMFAIALGLELFMMAWFFGLGGCLGSFLNVVVYRVPLGRTLWGSSYCPHCGHSIRSRDNIPVLGWLGLRGRCRDCRKTIATRYVRIELLMACLFLVLAIAELGFPFQWIRPATNRFNLGFVKVLLEPDLVQWIRFLVHIALVATLVAIWQMRLDGQTPPWGFLATAWLAQLIPGLAVPWVHSAYWSPIFDVAAFRTPDGLQEAGSPLNDMLMALRNIFWMGGIGGSACALIYGVVCRKDPRENRAKFGVMAGLVGWTLGITWGIPCVCLALLARVFMRSTDGTQAWLGIDENLPGKDTCFLRFLFVFCFMALLFASQAGSLDAQMLSFLIGRGG